MKIHLAIQASLVGVGAGQVDRGRIQVIAIHVDIGISQGHSDAGPTRAAANVCNLGGWIGPQAVMDVRDGREPFLAELLQEHGPVNAGLTLTEVVSILAEGDAATGAKGVQQ